MANKLPCHIRIIEARDLKAADVHGTSDPLVVVSLRGLLKKKHRTSTISNTVNPVWDEEFVLEPHHPEKDTIVIKVYDRDVVKNDLLGMVRIPVFAYFNRGPIDEWRPLVTRTGQPARGDIHLQISWGTGPISHALSDSASLMTNRQAYGEPATALHPGTTGWDQGNTGSTGYQGTPLGTSQSGTTQPGMTQPGMTQPGMSQPLTGYQGSQPGTTQPGMTQPLTGYQGSQGSQSGMAQQGMTQPLTGMPQNGDKQPLNSAYQPGGASVGHVNPNGSVTTTTTIQHGIQHH